MMSRACSQKEDIEVVAGASRLHIEVLRHKDDTAGVVGASQLDIEVLQHKEDTVGVGAEEPEHAPVLDVTPVAVGLAVGYRATNKDP